MELVKILIQVFPEILLFGRRQELAAEQRILPQVTQPSRLQEGLYFKKSWFEGHILYRHRFPIDSTSIKKGLYIYSLALPHTLATKKIQDVQSQNLVIQK